MELDPQKIPFVKAGQPVKAEDYNNLLRAVRAATVRPSADHKVSRTPFGTLLANKNSKGGRTEELIYAFKVTYGPVNPDLTDPEVIANLLHFKMEAGNCIVIGGDTTYKDVFYPQIAKTTEEPVFYVALRYTFGTNYTAGTWGAVEIVDKTTYDTVGGDWDEFDADGFLIARNYIIATINLDLSGSEAVLDSIVQGQIGDLRIYDVWISSNSFGDA